MEEVVGQGQDFRLDGVFVRPALSLLEVGQQQHHIEPKVMAVLVHLATYAGEVVSREQLMQAIWSEVVVSDESITRAISELRSALDDDPKSPQFIKTIPKKGYVLLSRPVFLEEPKRSTLADAYVSAHSHQDRARLQPVLWTGAFLAAVVLVVLFWAALVDPNKPSNNALREVVQRSSSTPTLAIRVAVTPFDSLSQREDDLFLSLGLTRDITNQLSMIPNLGVVPVSSMMEFVGHEQSIRGIAAAVDARFVVSGQLEPRADRFRLRMALIDAHRNIQLWAQNYDRPLDMFFELQDTLVSEIATALSAEIQIGVVRHRPKGEFNYPAYQLVEQAEQLRRTYNKEASQQIEAKLTQALELQPDNAAARALFAMQLAQNLVSRWSDNPIQTRQRIALQLDTAIAQAPRNARVLMAAGISSLMVGDHANAYDYLRESLDINPNEAHTLAELGYVEYRVTGNLASCVDKTSKAEQLAPNHPRISFWSYRRGTCLFLEGEYDKAAIELELTIRKNPTYYHPYFFRALALYNANRTSEADEMMRDGFTLASDLTSAEFLHGIKTFDVPFGPGVSQFESAFERLAPTP
ncbi:MAG: winged helix-turn-helix domain-containing protein [Pseudomonadota bacterium]